MNNSTHVCFDEDLNEYFPETIQETIRLFRGSKNVQVISLQCPLSTEAAPKGGDSESIGPFPDFVIDAAIPSEAQGGLPFVGERY